MSERDELEEDTQPDESRRDDQTTHRRDMLKAVGVGAIGLSGLANATGRVSADQAPIEDWNDLRTLAVDPSFEILDKTLVADLDADTPGYEEHVQEPAGGWEPINIDFITLDGNGHTISDLAIDRPNEDDVDLFGRLEYGEMENLSVRDADITGRDNVGTLMGYGRGCSVVNSDATGLVSGDVSVGGFIGFMENDGSVTDSYTEQQISGSGSVGGLIGIKSRGSVSNSHATGPVDSDGKAGGLVGDASEISITNSYATGAVSGGDGVGGLVGSSSIGSSIEESYATGAVSGGDSVGGLAGSLGIGGVTNSYATNSVDGEGTVGGLIGFLLGSGFQTYATGPVSGTENVGGLIGRLDPDAVEVTDSYWDVPASGQDESAGGTGLGTLADEPPAEEMTGEDATEYMEGFDFADTWETTTSYPILAWQDPRPSVADYTDEDGRVTTDGLREAVDDWRAGDINTELLRDVVDAWRSREPIT